MADTVQFQVNCSVRDKRKRMLQTRGREDGEVTTFFFSYSFITLSFCSFFFIAVQHAGSVKRKGVTKTHTKVRV